MKKVYVVVMSLFAMTNLISCGGGGSSNGNGGDTPPNVNGQWVQVGAPLSNQVNATLPLFYDKATKSIYQLDYLSSPPQLCSISEDASTSTAWDCTILSNFNNVILSNVTSDLSGHIYAFGVDHNTTPKNTSMIYTIDMQSRTVSQSSKVYENYYDGTQYVEEPIERRSGISGFDYYNGQLYWFSTPYGSLTESSMSATPSGGAATIQYFATGFTPSSRAHIDPLSGILYSYYNWDKNFATSTPTGMNVQSWVSSTSVIDDFTIVGKNMYTCNEDLTHPVQMIELTATSETSWQSISSNGISGYCFSIASGDGYLFANAQVAQDSVHTPPVTLVKYKY